MTTLLPSSPPLPSSLSTTTDSPHSAPLPRTLTEPLPRPPSQSPEIIPMAQLKQQTTASDPDPDPKAPPSPPRYSSSETYQSDPPCATSMPDALSEAAVMKKVSRRLIPFLGFLYLLSFLDRVNVGNAHNDFLKDNNMDETDYTNGVGIFFLGYCLFEIPSNLAMKRFSPRKWIARIMVSWGIASVCMMFVHDLPSFLIVRLMLGIAEAGFFPGVVYYLTLWYPPQELASKIGQFFSSSAIAGIVSGFLAYYILQLDGAGDLKGWQWLFLMEGLPTVIAGVAVWFVLPDGPRHASWLTPAEQDLVIHRLSPKSSPVVSYGTSQGGKGGKGDRDEQQQQQIPGGDSTYGSQWLSESAPVNSFKEAAASSSQAAATVATPPAAVAKSISWADFRATVTDPFVLLMATTYLFLLIPTYSLAFFLPSIISAFGFSTLISNLLTVPVYTIALVCIIVVSYSSDRRKERLIHALVMALIATVSFALLTLGFKVDSTALKYIMVTLATASSWCCIPLVLAWLMGILKSSTSSATGSAFVISFGNIGGYLGPKIFSLCNDNACSCSFMSGSSLLLALGIVLIRFFHQRKVRLASSSDEEDRRAILDHEDE